MKLIPIALLVLIASLTLTGCASSPSLEEQVEEKVSEFRSDFESKLVEYEDCLKKNLPSPEELEMINKYLTERSKIKPSIEKALRSCSEYRP